MTNITDELIKQVPDDTVIWRFLNIQKLKWLFDDEAIYFRQLRQYWEEDPSEGWFPDFLRIEGFEGVSLQETLKKDKLNPNSPWLYSGTSCWHIADQFSWHMWEAYSNGQGAAIKSTVANLKEAIGRVDHLGELQFGAITYHDEFDHAGIQGDGFNQTKVSFFWKKRKFEEESEFRALLTASSPTGQKRMNVDEGINVVSDLDILIDDLYVPKKQAESHRKRVKELIREAGFEDRIVYI